MARRRAERPEWVVQLDVCGIAVVSVRAVDEQEAWTLAEAACRPVDVTELSEVEAAIVSGPHPPLRRGRRPVAAGAPETPAKGRA